MIVGGVVKNGRRVAVLEGVSLKRKNSLSLSLTAWSNRTLVESSELGFDQLPINCPVPFVASGTPLELGKGNAFITGRSGPAAGALPDGQAPVPRIQRSG